MIRTRSTLTQFCAQPSERVKISLNENPSRLAVGFFGMVFGIQPGVTIST
jgi:hypothetical protein